MTSLYRYFDTDGTLLYVGVSVNPFLRERRHRREKDMTQVRYVELEWFSSDEAAYEAEKHAIKQERPLWNVVHKDKPRRCRVTHIPAKPLDIPAPKKAPCVPIITGGILGRYFGCGNPDRIASVPPHHVYDGTERGVHRVCRVMRRGDVLIAGKDVALGEDHIAGMLFGGVHHCVPNV